MRNAGILLAATISALVSSAAFAQAAKCDPRLQSSGNDPYSYRLRGDRCEGTYIQEVAGAPLTIASWTQSRPEYDLTSSHPLQIRWEMPGSGEVRLRAQSLRRRTYYQMDTVRPSRSNSYEWPDGLLAAVKIPSEELGVTGSARLRIGQTDRDVYLPVRIFQAGSAAPGGYHLILLPGVQLDEVFVTIAAVKGGKEAILKNGEPLGYGYYPAERAIDVTIAPPAETGIYRLEIGAVHKGGGASTAELWFYHSGNL
jgi:hypothetical protein